MPPTSRAPKASVATSSLGQLNADAAGSRDVLLSHAGVRRLLATQVASNVVINAVLPSLMLWLLRAPAPKTILGAGGVLSAVTITAIIGTLMTFLTVTRSARALLRTYPAVPASAAGLPLVFRLSPTNDVVAALLILAGALVIVAPIMSAAVVGLAALPLDRGGFVLFNLAAGGLVGLVVTPSIVLRALLVHSAPSSQP